MIVAPPKDLNELQIRANQLAGLSLEQISQLFDYDLPDNLNHHKGWLGDLMESILGANAGNAADADFVDLGIELKTLPINDRGLPIESTFVSSIDMKNTHNLNWQESVVYKKLCHVLFIPIRVEKERPIKDRIVATPLFWSPSSEETTQIRQDWLEIMETIQLGKLNELDSRIGKFLQIRPKAANAKDLTTSVNEYGEICETLPRGFYLRASFTRTICEQHFLQ